MFMLMENYYTLDNIDQKILMLLQKDAKMTIKEVAIELNLSTTPIFERIKKLEERNFIKGYHAEINRHLIGLGLMVFCNVSLKEHQSNFLKKFELEVQSIDEIMACYHLGGNYDYLLTVCVKNIDAYHDFIANKLANISNIANVQSSFVMKEIKETKQYYF
mgnify:CR=1 FL=1